MDQKIEKKVVVGEDNEIIVKETEKKIMEKSVVKKPKRPLGSYFLFMKDLKERGVGMSRSEATKYWKEMPKNEKSKYINQSEKLKKEYAEKLKKYEEIYGEDNENNESGDEDNHESEQEISLIPYARVKSILKCDEENSKQLRKNVVLLMKSAAEKFASNLIMASIQDLRKKDKRTLNRNNLIAGILNEYKYSFLLDSCIFEEDEIQEVEADNRNYVNISDKKSGKKVRRSDNNQLLSEVINNGKMIEEKDLENFQEKNFIEKSEMQEEEDYPEIREQVREDNKKKKAGNGLFDYFKKKA